LLSYLFVNKLHLKRRWWVLILSSIAFLIALKMAVVRFI
jgi:hypothetical protein